jgi:phage baseplate assembly protein W
MRLKNYVGFSTVAKTGTATKLIGIDLINQDLLNEFNLKLGDMPTRPLSGCIIWDLLFDLEDSQTTQKINADIDRILAGEPRVQELSRKIDINQDSSSITITLFLKYLGFNQSSSLTIPFNHMN